MGNLQSRLTAIREKRAELNAIESNKMSEKEMNRLDFINKVETLDERISNLLILANELADNDFLLGEIGGDYNLPTPRFISDGICHRFGFIVDGNPYREPHKCRAYGIGVKGGGCNGNDFVVNDEGCIIEWNEQIFDEGIEKFMSKFNQFEQDFFNFVDDLVK